MLLVDNASTDGTGEVALSAWPRHHPVPIRVVREERPGLTNARLCGIKESKFDIIAFIDDDNWVQGEWINGVSETMSKIPRIGALGVYSEPVFESEPPTWFWDHFFYYAVHKPGDHRSLIYGAGLCLRRSALENLFLNGFTFLAMDRLGKSLSSSGDVEICRALELSGWKVHFEENIRIRHFIPGSRTHLSYLRRLYRGIGESGVLLDGYNFKSMPKKMFHSIRVSWIRQFFSSVLKLVSTPILLFQAIKGTGSYSKAILECEFNLGRLLGLMRNRPQYSRKIKSIESARWHSR